MAKSSRRAQDLSHTNDHDVIETIRKMRTFLPLPQAMVQWIVEQIESNKGENILPGKRGLAYKETYPLLLRYFGCPWPLSTPEREEQAFHAKVNTQAMLSAPLIMMARAAIEFGPQLTVMTLHPSAVQRVRDTDLKFWPSSPPKLLQKPIILEADPRKGDGCLFDRISRMVFLPADYSGFSTLVVQDRDLGLALDKVEFVWSPDDNHEEVQTILSSNKTSAITIDPQDGAPTVAHGAVLNFLVTLSMLLEAESEAGQRVMESSTLAGKLPDGRAPKPGHGFTRKYIRISGEKEAHKPSFFSQPSLPLELPDKDHLVPQLSTVRGFLRRQRHGPGGSLRKIIYIAPFSRIQWVSEEKQIVVT